MKYVITNHVLKTIHLIVLGFLFQNCYNDSKKESEINKNNSKNNVSNTEIQSGISENDDIDNNQITNNNQLTNNTSSQSDINQIQSTNNVSNESFSQNIKSNIPNNSIPQNNITTIDRTQNISSPKPITSYPSAISTKNEQSSVMQSQITSTTNLASTTSDTNKKEEEGNISNLINNPPKKEPNSIITNTPNILNNVNIGIENSENLKTQYDEIINILKSSGLTDFQTNFDDSIGGVQLLSSKNINYLENKNSEALQKKRKDLGIEKAKIGEKKAEKKQVQNFLENSIGKFKNVKQELQKITYESISDKSLKNTLKTKHIELLKYIDQTIKFYIRELHEPKNNPLLPKIPSTPYDLSIDGSWVIKKRSVDFRFEELDNILKNDNQVVVYFPGKSALKHDLGTGIAKHQQDAAHLRELISVKIDELENKYPNRIRFAYYNVNNTQLIYKSPDHGVHQMWASSKRIQTFGGNWSQLRLQNGFVGTFGGGQAGGFSKMCPGVFPINTMDVNDDISIILPLVNHSAKY